MKLVIKCTFTESPSFNMRVLSDGVEIFYNSERLQGNWRTRSVGEILGLKELKVGEITVDATREQVVAISSIPSGLMFNEKTT